MSRTPANGEILVGDGRVRLKELPPASVHALATSPPYFGLRSYGTEPLVWDDADGAGEHAWGAPVRAPWANALPGPSDNVPKNGAARARAPIAGQLCAGHAGEALVHPAANGLVRRPMAGATLNEASATRAPTTSDRCPCGAWRGHLGGEPILDCYGWVRGLRCYVCHLRRIFDLAKRVLRPEGSLWVVIGDCYNNRHQVRPSSHQKGLGSASESTAAAWRELTARGETRMSLADRGLKEKDLMGVPWHLALALRTDGWHWRQENVWHKRACMPESVRDRCTRGHEAILHFTQAARYFYDAPAIYEPFADARGGRDGGRAPRERDRGGRADGFTKPNGIDPSANGGRNKRSVWTLGPEPSKLRHFAMYPTRLVEPMILATTSARGVCAACGAPYRPVYRRATSAEADGARAALAPVEYAGKHAAAAPTAAGRRVLRSMARARASRAPGVDRDRPFIPPLLDGWERTCACATTEIVPATVLDPFVGSGTTLLVAGRLGRRGIGIELSPEYAATAAARLTAAFGAADDTPDEEQSA